MSYCLACPVSILQPYLAYVTPAATTAENREKRNNDDPNLLGQKVSTWINCSSTLYMCWLIWGYWSKEKSLSHLTNNCPGWSESPQPFTCDYYCNCFTLWPQSIVKSIVTVYCEVLDSSIGDPVIVCLTNSDVELSNNTFSKHIPVRFVLFWTHLVVTICQYLIANVKWPYLRCCGAKTKFDIESPCSSRSSYNLCKRFSIETITWIIQLLSRRAVLLKIP